MKRIMMNAKAEKGVHHNSLHCCLHCHLLVVFLSLHCHPHRCSLPQFSSYTTTFHRFCIAISPHVLHFHLNCRIFSRFLSSLLQSLSTSMPFVCLHYHYHYYRERSLHRCSRCFRRWIAVMSSLFISHVVTFHMYLHSNQPTLPVSYTHLTLPTILRV